MLSDAVLLEIREGIAGLKNAKRGAAIRDWAARLGCSPKAIYRRLPTEGRKAREDRGQSRVATDEQMTRIAGLMMESWDDKNRIKMPGWVAIKMAEDAGIIEPGQVSPSALDRWMSHNRISKREARAATPHVELRTSACNEVHEYDTSQCSQWYIDNDGGRLNFQRWDYKNKPLKGLPLKRHMLVDHFSGCFFVMYLPSEDTATSLEFLFSAWQVKTAGVLFAAMGMNGDAEQIARAERIGQGFPFHGAPRMLLTDNGSLLKSATGRLALERMQIRYQTHAVGNPRAKGSCESMMWKWEQAFESQLRRNPAKDLVEFNLRAIEFAAWHQQQKLHSRHKQTRFGFFVRQAREDDIRELPEDRARLRALALRAEEQRQIDYRGVIRFDGRLYAVPDQGLWGQTALVGIDIFHAPDLYVKCDGRSFNLKALDVLPGGFSEQSVPMGEYRSPRDTDTVKGLKRLARETAGTSDVRIEGRYDLAVMSGPRGAGIEPEHAPVERVFGRVAAKAEIARRQGYPMLKWQQERVELEIGEKKEIPDCEIDRIHGILCEAEARVNVG